MEGVCILFKQKDSEWKTAKALMNNLGEFMASLKNYPKDSITEGTINKLKKVVTHAEYY